VPGLVHYDLRSTSGIWLSPLPPTATQSAGVGHDTADSEAPPPPATGLTGSSCHDVPFQRSASKAGVSLWLCAETEPTAMQELAVGQEMPPNHVQSLPPCPGIACRVQLCPRSTKLVAGSEPATTTQRVAEAHEMALGARAPRPGTSWRVHRLCCQMYIPSAEMATQRTFDTQLTPRR
jgi:hypothetical protein